MLSESLGDWIRESRTFSTGPLVPARAGVEALLPHRESMLLVDHIVGVSPDLGALAAGMTVRHDDPFLRGHFPGDPVYPGVLQVEAIAQAGVCLVRLATGNDADADARVRAVKLLHAQFVGEIRPGDALEIEVKTFEVSTLLSTFGGRISCRGELKTLAIVEVYVGQ